MTQHTATATVTTSGAPVTLGVKAVSATLDDAWAPYAQVNLTCFAPAPAVLETIDPRQPSTVTLTLTGDVARVFTLSLRSRTINHVTGELTIVAESHEAKLMDWRRVATTVDTTALAYQNSLRALINAVVLAPIGAVLEADNGADADLTVWSDQTNLVPNPSFETNLTGWTGSGCTVARSTGTASGFGTALMSLSAPSSTGAFARSGSFAVTPGATYVLRGTGYGAGTGAVSPYARKLLFMDTATSTIIGETPAVPNTSTYSQVSAQLTIPAGITGVTILAYHGHAAGQVLWDAIKLAQITGQGDATYFDGSTPATAQYSYSWTGVAHGSPSLRTNLTGTHREAAMFAWVPGVSAWDFVQPLVQAGALRLFCDEQAKWHLVDPNKYSVPGLVSLSAATNTTEAEDTIDRYAEWFDSVVIQYQWNGPDGLTHTEWDVAGVAGGRTLLLEKQSPFPGFGAATAVLRRQQARGRVQALSAVSDYKVTPGQGLQSAMPGTTTQLGAVSAVVWAQPLDEMKIRSRGLDDLTTSSWLAQPVGKKWLDVPVGTSWNSYPV